MTRMWSKCQFYETIQENSRLILYLTPAVLGHGQLRPASTLNFLILLQVFFFWNFSRSTSDSKSGSNRHRFIFIFSFKVQKASREGFLFLFWVERSGLFLYFGSNGRWMRFRRARRATRPACVIGKARSQSWLEAQWVRAGAPGRHPTKDRNSPARREKLSLSPENQQISRFFSHSSSERRFAKFDQLLRKFDFKRFWTIKRAFTVEIRSI